VYILQALSAFVHCSLYKFNSLATEAAATEFQSMSHVHSKCRLITGSRVSLKRMCFAGQALMKYQVNIHIASFHGARPETLPGHNEILRVKEARRIHESLRSVKADTFATLVARSMQHGRRATPQDGTHLREATARVAAGDHNGLAVLVRRVIKRLSTS
jgi:hypothetical protein